jgi:hypothetical protein
VCVELCGARIWIKYVGVCFTPMVSEITYVVERILWMIDQQLVYSPIHPERAMWWPLGCYLWRCLNGCGSSSDDLIKALALALNSRRDIDAETMHVYVYLINGAFRLSRQHKRVSLWLVADDLGYLVETLIRSLDDDDETNIFSDDYSDSDGDGDGDGDG